MSLHKLKRSFEERRNMLIQRLDKNRHELDLSQQHQIYGAIKEIENFLKSIDQHRMLQTQNSFDLDLSQENEWPIVERSQKIFRDAKTKCVEAAQWTFVDMPIRVSAHLRGRYEEYQERRELYNEVKREVEQKMRKKTKKK